MLPKSLSEIYILKRQLSPKFIVEEMPFKQGVKLERQSDKFFLKGFVTVLCKDKDGLNPVS